MDTRIDDTIRGEAALSAAVARVSPVLEEVIGSPASRITAEWTSRNDGQGRAVLNLRLSDYTANPGPSADFSPDELEPNDRLRHRFHRLWGDLLSLQFDRIQERLRTLLPESVTS